MRSLPPRSLIAVLVATALAPPVALAGVARWTATGPPGAFVSSLAVAPSADQVVYAGGMRRVFRSDDSGMQWLDDQRTLPHGNPSLRFSISVLGVDPTDPRLLFAGGPGTPLYTSRDGGESWREAIPGSYVYAVQIHPLDRRRVFAAMDSGLFRSSDGGKTWSKIHETPLFHVAVDPTDPDEVYTAGFLYTGPYGVFRSRDGGSTWQRLDFPGPLSVRALLHHPVSPGILYIYGPEGLYKSTDAGSTWLRASASYFGDLVQVVADSANNLYAAAFAGVFVSPDGGHTWLPRRPPSWSEPASPPEAIALATSHERPGTVYAAGGGTIWKSLDAGEHWEELLSPINVTVRAVAVDPVDPRLAYCACTSRSTFFRSVDGGFHWQSLETGVNFPSTTVVDSRSPFRVFAAGGSQVAFSDDRGERWSSGNGAAGAITSMAIDPFDSAIVYAGSCCGPRGTAGGVLRSSDSGATWRRTSAGLGPDLPGQSVYGVLTVPGIAGVVYAGTVGGVFRSTDRGETWSRTSLMDPVAALVADSTDPLRIYAGLFFQGGVVRTDDGGVTWQRFGNAFSALWVTALAIDPGDRSVLYAGTNGSGVFRSADRGASWTPMNAGLTDLQITSLAIDSSSRLLHAGTSSSGVFRVALRRAREVGFRPAQ